MRKFLNGLVGATALATPALAQTTDTTNIFGSLGIAGLLLVVGIGALIYWLFFRGGGD